MPVDAKTIQIFLPSGEPQGMRIAEITTRIVQAIQVPRTRLEQFFARRESERVGIYFLFGERDGAIKPVVYIGQTEDLVGRLKIHHGTKEFWTTAVVVISRTQSFTQAHIKYLEWLSIKATREAARYTLDNGNEGSKPYVPEPMEADVLDAFDTTATLLATLGFPLFEPPAGRQGAQQHEIFYCRGPNADARGARVDEGFVIFAGSITRRSPAPSAQDFIPWLAGLQKDGMLEPINNEEYKLVQDHVVNSPSSAASLVLARKANGWQEWRRADGTTLHDVYRASAQEVETP